MPPANQSASAAVPTPSSRLPILIIGSASLLGLLARAIALSLAPQNSYLPDHLDNMAWSDFAFKHGPQRIYDFPEKSGIVVRGRDVAMVVPHACNYPPGAAYLFWCQGALWHALDSKVATVPALPVTQQATGQTHVSTRVIDTPTSRFVQALPSILLDFVLAWGVAAIVCALQRDKDALTRRFTLPAAIAYAVVLLAPPVFLDSAFWNQTDSWISALLVWTLWAFLTDRFALAGVFFGLALVTKPQAILFGPVVFLIALSLRFAAGGIWTRVFRLWKTAAGALAAIIIVTLPFLIADAAHPDGPLRWFHRSYAATIGAEAYKGTTFNAFNLWWLHWMSQGATLEQRSSAKPMFLGLTRQTVGSLLLAVGVVAAMFLPARRWRWSPHAWLACAYLVCLAAFTLPTAVHERYVYFCLPFLIALTCLDWRPWLAPLLALLLVGTLEMTAFRWVRLDNATVRAQTTALALLTVLAFAYSLLVVSRRRVTR